MFKLFRLITFLECLLKVSGDWNIALSVSRQVHGAAGGEVFEGQPQVTVFDKKGNLQGSIVGVVQAELYESPSGHGRLLSHESAGLILATVNHGVAEFSGLFIENAGESYRLRFTMKDEHNITLGSVAGDAFSVEIGEAYRIGLVANPENAFGGTPWGTQPVVAVQDRGSNTVMGFNTGVVRVELLVHDDNQAELHVSEGEDFDATFEDGLAEFHGLFVDVAGTYKVRFKSTLLLPGMVECESAPFSVGIGPPSELVVDIDPSDGVVIGGHAFLHQPRIKAVDKGGNLLLHDFSSTVSIDFFSNPSGGSLHPKEHVHATIRGGIAQFNNLMIDKSGVSYRLCYSMKQGHEGASVQTLGKYFDVSVGSPSGIRVLRHSSNGWAGNQPIPVQPKIGLVDAGGNVVKEDSASVVRAFLTPSLAVSTQIVIDTSNGSIPHILSLKYDANTVAEARKVYGSGDIITIELTFSQEVTVLPSSHTVPLTTHDLVRPTLELNAIDDSSIPSYAFASLSPASVNIRSRKLIFEYVVLAHHYQPRLNYLSTTSLIANDFSILDGLGRNVNLTLPLAESNSSLLGPKELSINNNASFVLGVTSDHGSGDYGAGESLMFHLNFSREVAVKGMPVLPMNVNSTVAIIDTFTTGRISASSHFFIWYRNVRTVKIPWDASATFLKNAVEGLSTVTGSICVSRSASPNSAESNGSRWAIRFESLTEDPSDPLLRVDSSGMQMLGPSSGGMSLHLLIANAPVAGWVTNDGNANMCFTRVAKYMAGSGTKTLSFQFLVKPGDYTARLDVTSDSLARISFFDSGGEIFSAANHDISKALAADLSLHSSQLPSDVVLAIDSQPPSITSIMVQTLSTPNGTYAVGDSLFFEINFTQPVVVDKGVELRLATGEVGGWAKFDSGSGSKTLLLIYDVLEGQHSLALDYDGYDALIARNIVMGYIRRASTFPTTEALLTLPSAGSTPADTSEIVVDGMQPQISSLSFEAGNEGRTFVEGENVTILVEYSAPVLVMNGVPVLTVLVGTNEREREAFFVSGSGSHLLKFVYTVLVGDSSVSPSFFCNELCILPYCGRKGEGVGYIRRFSSNPILDADPTLPSEGGPFTGVPLASGPNGININTSGAGATRIVSVTTSNPEGIYGVGEEIWLHVHFTDIVHCSTPTKPTLLATFGVSICNVEYESGSGTNTLTFGHVTSVADATNGLDWALYPSSNSAIFCDANAVSPCLIKNENEVKVDLSFTDSSGVISVDPLNTSIIVDVVPPSIVSVFTNKTRSQNCLSANQLRPLLRDCVYSVGEVIVIFVRFDKPVVVAGPGPRLRLNTTDHDGGEADSFAVYINSESNETDLAFIYEVKEGHTSAGGSLTYTCIQMDCSLDLGPSSLSSVKRLASFPTVDVDLQLPTPSQIGLSRDGLNPILVDTSKFPLVSTVQAISADGVYSPGDIIYLSVSFTEVVVVAGMPELYLNVGNGGRSGIARYSSGSGSTALIFEYSVSANDFSVDLDYIDIHSLRQGMDGAKAGRIRLESTLPTLDADLVLPSPGSEGSLRYSSNIAIDNRKPHIVTIGSDENPGRYTDDDQISIVITFSLPVVVEGNPILLLETGAVDRHAVFSSQNNETALEFQYTVELGDEANALDYWTDEGLSRSSANSFQLNGGRIRRKSALPIIDADLHLNPSRGYLDGTGPKILDEGVALFDDLRIGMRGADYKIRFTSRPNSINAGFETTTMLSIDTSIEYEVFGDQNNRDDGDLLGSSVSLSRNILAVGAPHKRNPTPEVQVLTVYSESSSRQEEVQLITTQVNVTEATKQVSAFTTSADPDHTVGGTFSVTCYYNTTYVYASPAVFDADVSPDQLKAILEELFPLVGNVETSRVKNTACECGNGWTWRITFADASSGMIGLETDGAGLQGPGSVISVVEVEQPTSLIRGSFFLVNPFTKAISRDVPYNSSASLVKEIIEMDLAIKVQSVMSANTDTKRDLAGLGRRWTCIFSYHEGLFGNDVNVPNLEVNGDYLLGHSAIVWTHVGFEGRGVLSGFFAVSLRGSQYSDFIPHNASAVTLQSALQSLDSVNTVSVTARKDIGHYSDLSGSSWTVTFVSVNRESDYGWLPDPGGESSIGNLPALEVNRRLIGWNAGHKVEHEFGAGDMDTQAQWMAKSRGDAGFRSGSVLIYKNDGGQWKHEAKLLASDHSSHDAFGHSIDVADSFLVVGAPLKEVDGLPEQQSLVCVGPVSGGNFTIEFRGFASSPIPFDATAGMIHQAMVGPYGNTTNLHSIPWLSVAGTAGWDGESNGFCSTGGNEAVVTMWTPDGSGLSTLDRVSADIELLSVDSSQLTGGKVIVKENRKGTRAFMGVDFERTKPSGKQAGCAYLFQRNSLCEFCPFHWSQLKKLTPVDGMDIPMDSAEFGWAVSTSQINSGAQQIVAIGSPGALNERGAVYLFRGLPTSTEWVFENMLTSTVWTPRTPGDRFGENVLVEGDTILVSAPGYASNRGIVFVFIRSSYGISYLSSQAIHGPTSLSVGDKFGQSIALSGNRAVLCAPGKDDNVIHTGTSPGTSTTTDSGACYVYSRGDIHDSFELFQQLKASNLKARDQFGSSVAMSENIILVGQLANTIGSLVPPRPTQVLHTSSNVQPCPQPLGGTFRLRWLEDMTPLRTRPLPTDVTASNLRDVLEKDLLTGPLTVTRTAHPDNCGGYSWSITYDSFERFSKKTSPFPILQCDGEVLVGSSPSCSVQSEFGISKHGRGKAHIFTLDGTWTEQAFLFPRAPQRQDMFGASVALSNSVAVVGAKNRALLNVNSGTALAFSLDFLSIRFSRKTHTVLEGDSLKIELSRAHAEHQQITAVRSVDINAKRAFQEFIDEIFSLRSAELFPLDRTPADLLNGNTAIGRDQFYGSFENKSVWVDGVFDYRGISDYKVLGEALVMNAGELNASVVLQTTDDNIYEFPDENLTLQVDIPGMFASQLGSLTTHAQIKDNGDGYCSHEIATYYSKIKGDELDGNGERFGSAIDIDDAAGIMVVGNEFSMGSSADGVEFPRAGAAFVYTRASGSWMLNTTLSADSTQMARNGLFGQSVAVSTPYGRSDTAILVGAPGQAAAFIFAYDPITNMWTEEALLRATGEELLSQHHFATAGSIALYGDIAFVGSPVVETVYSWRKIFLPEKNEFDWVSWSVLRSSAYDYDVYDNGFTVRHMHRQDFGVSLAVHQRTLLVGAPYADYGNRGNVTQRENVDTDGIDNEHLGNGRVYAFHSVPHAQLVSLACDEELSAGSFRLALYDHLGVMGLSDIIPHAASATQLKFALEQAVNVGEVHVTEHRLFDKGRPDRYRMEWSITWPSEYSDYLPLLTPLWEGNGCSDCLPLATSTLSTVSPSITVSVLSVQSPFQEEGTMQAKDRGASDGFGLSLAVDGKQAIIGSKASAARTRTTFNFETGTLIGWTRTGDAFDYQPTFGDNSRQRGVYDGFGGARSETSGQPQSSNMEGRYYVGTFELRPGNKDKYQTANDKPIGSFQGDEPMGTLTSDPFIVLGDEVTFLIGGGCNHLTVYSELIVDGFVVTRATGKCTERMNRVKWDVSNYVGRAAQFRVVDQDSGQWGHISVDEIQFSWDVNRKCFDHVNNECVNGGGELPRDSAKKKQHYARREDTAASGSAYLFVRDCGIDATAGGRFGCLWVEQQRIAASNKRAGNSFGTSVDVDDVRGIALVGSAHSPSYGLFHELNSIYPHDNPTYIDFPIEEDMENSMKSGLTHSALGGFLVDQIASDRSNDYYSKDKEAHLSEYNQEAGAVYVFKRISAALDDNDNVVRPEYWLSTEDARMTPPDVAARDKFGHSVAMHGFAAAVGAIGAGASYTFDLRVLSVRFSDVQFVALEGTDSQVKIVVHRDLSESHTRLSVGYSTSDLSARGVDSLKYNECESVSVPSRMDCGDYEQTTGELTFLPGVETTYFEVRIMNDFCKEPHLEYVQLNLHLPGGGPLHGERYRALLRVDDDDLHEEHCIDKPPPLNSFNSNNSK
uniref:Calx-beta domain-containing protein n=1 Tax=Odontella aurita TaxID=265563 RepID=A0A7S4JS32_9STRA|mmetsp:Transcript_5292/g.15381  ORF Transcript_5292/g.15381 Transcript_5292/m.15381 type:complete len:3986 (+) Transcript_5292:696-12653(+)